MFFMACSQHEGMALYIYSKTGLWQRYNGIRVPFTYFELWKILISFFSRRQWGLKWGCTERATPSNNFWKRRGGAFARRRFFCGLAGGWPAGFRGRHGGVHVQGWDFVGKKISQFSQISWFSLIRETDTKMTQSKSWAICMQNINWNWQWFYLDLNYLKTSHF